MQPATIDPTFYLCTIYPLRLGGWRQCEIPSLPDSSTHGQHWESNPRPSDLESNALCLWHRLPQVTICNRQAATTLNMWPNVWPDDFVRTENEYGIYTYDLFTPSATAQLVHSLVTSRIDYCNALLLGVPDYKIKCLQRMHNIVARVVARPPHDHDIDEVLQSLHWLPVKSRILFKTLLLVYKCEVGLSPEYLSVVSWCPMNRNVMVLGQMILIFSLFHLLTLNRMATELFHLVLLLNGTNCHWT